MYGSKNSTIYNQSNVGSSGYIKLIKMHKSLYKDSDYSCASQRVRLRQQWNHSIGRSKHRKKCLCIISFYTKIPKHIMTSITIKANWQTQEIGKITPEETEIMVQLAKVFKMSFRIFKKINEEIACSNWQQVIKLEKEYLKKNQKWLKIKNWVKNLVDVINGRLNKVKENQYIGK